MSDRQMLYREETLIDDCSSFEGKTLEEVIEILKEFRETYPKDRIVFSNNSGYDYQELQLLREFKSLEDDVEYKARTTREKYLAKQEANKNSKERALYLKLKKKYEESPVSRGRPRKTK